MVQTVKEISSVDYPQHGEGFLFLWLRFTSVLRLIPDGIAEAS
jgi:hypothetical protein